MFWVVRVSVRSDLPSNNQMCIRFRFALCLRCRIRYKNGFWPENLKIDLSKTFMCLDLCLVYFGMGERVDGGSQLLSVSCICV